MIILTAALTDQQCEVTMDLEQKESILAECKELMAKAHYDEPKIDQFCETVEEILQETIDHFNDREINYKLVKHLDSVEFKLNVSGEKIDPMTEGEGAEDRRFQNAVNRLLFNPDTAVSVRYSSGWNHLVVKSPSKIANSKLLNEPMVKAMLLGIVAGIICRFIPEEASDLILNGIAAPIMSTIIGLLMGIMGPVFFLFIIVAISSLGSMDELAKTGKVVLKRFVLVSLWVALLTVVVALFFFPVWGAVDTSIDLTEVESALLSVLPTDFITPFAEGQIPQVILLGIVFGIALLMMGDSGKPVQDALAKIKEWAMCIMALMMKVVTLIPFISTMMIVANGELSAFLQGWKYIAAAYICYLLTIAIEFVAVSVRCKKGVKDLMGMLKGIATMAFVTAIPQMAIQSSYEVSEKDMGIDASFTDLWLSLSYNLLSPARTISLVLSVFFIADLSGMSVNFAILLVMLIMVVQLSLASSGTVASTTVILETLKLPTEAVGLFSAFEIFTRNVAAAYDVTYSMLEEFDAARETDNIVGDGSSDSADTQEAE